MQNYSYELPSDQVIKHIFRLLRVYGISSDDYTTKLPFAAKDVCHSSKLRRVKFLEQIIRLITLVRAVQGSQKTHSEKYSPKPTA